MTFPTTEFEVVGIESDILRVGDLPDTTCFLKEERLWIKQQDGYCLALDNFKRYQVRSSERVDKVFSRVRISVE